MHPQSRDLRSSPQLTSLCLCHLSSLKGGMARQGRTINSALESTQGCSTYRTFTLMWLYSYMIGWVWKEMEQTRVASIRAMNCHLNCSEPWNVPYQNPGPSSVFGQQVYCTSIHKTQTLSPHLLTSLHFSTCDFQTPKTKSARGERRVSLHRKTRKVGGPTWANLKDVLAANIKADFGRSLQRTKTWIEHPSISGPLE